MPKVLNQLKLVLIGQERSQLWLSNELGVSQNTVTNWCLNKNQPSLKTLADIAVILNINIKDIIVDGAARENNSDLGE